MLFGSDGVLYAGEGGSAHYVEVLAGDGDLLSATQTSCGCCHNFGRYLHTDVGNDYLHIRSGIYRDGGCIGSVVGKYKRNLCCFAVDGELGLGLSYGETSYKVEIGALEGDGITRLLASEVGNFGNGRQGDDEVLLAFYHLFAIADGHTSCLCRFGHEEGNLVARMLLELIFENGVAHGEDHCIHEVEVVTLDGEQVARLHFCRREFVDADGLGVGDVALGEETSTCIFEFDAAHFRSVLGHGDHDAVFADDVDVIHNNIARENDTGDLVETAAHEADLSATGYWTGAECVE